MNSMRQIIALVLLAGSLIPSSGSTNEWREKWMSEMDRVKSQPNDWQMERLGTAVRSKSTAGGWVPTENQIIVANRAVALLLSTPGHAEYFRDRILAAQFAHRDDLESIEAGKKFNDYTTEVGNGMEVLSHLPSSETVRVLGELLSNDWTNPKGLNRRPEERYGPVCFRATKALGALPLISRPANTKTNADAKRDIQSWQMWYQQIKEGKRTFRFEGDPTEYDLDGPAPKEKLARIALDRKRDEERLARHHPGSRQPENLAEKTAAVVSKPGNLAVILSALLVLAAAIWYGLKRKRAGV